MGNEVKWVRVDSGERPEDKEEVKVKIEHDGAPKGYLERRVVYSSEYDDFWPYWDAVTHWAHLPEPPKPENCLTCRFAETIEGIDNIKICRDKLSGCFGTDVTVHEKCKRWKLEPPKEG